MEPSNTNFIITDLVELLVDRVLYISILDTFWLRKIDLGSSARHISVTRVNFFEQWTWPKWKTLNLFQQEHVHYHDVVHDHHVDQEQGTENNYIVIIEAIGQQKEFLYRIFIPAFY